MSTRHTFAAGRLPNRTDHLIAANAMIGEVCRNVRRRERRRAFVRNAAEWAQREVRNPDAVLAVCGVLFVFVATYLNMGAA